MITIGIDPGLTGAAAALDEQGIVLELDDLPVYRDAKLAMIDGDALCTWLFNAAGGRPARVLVERVHSMPKQGVSSSFTFGLTFGSILGAVRASKMPLVLVPPTQWKKALGLISDKPQALARARMLFPLADLARKKDIGRAEALLIAHWGRTQESL